jgi:hypothetical protein
MTGVETAFPVDLRVVLALLVVAPSGVDADDDGLTPHRVGALRDEFRPVERARVDGDLVGARAERLHDVGLRPDTAAHRERDEHLVRDRRDGVEHRLAAVGAGGDVEEDELVGARAVVRPGHLHRVARVLQVLEVDPRVHLRVAVLVQVDVDAGDDAFGEGHLLVSVGSRRAALTVTVRAIRRAPDRRPVGTVDRGNLMHRSHGIC